MAQSRPVVLVRSAGAPSFVWRHFGCYVELHPVRTGWLVLWGRFEDRGRRKVATGNRTYPELNGARRRLAGAVLDLTGTPTLAADALALLDRTPLPRHHPAALPDPL